MKKCITPLLITLLCFGSTFAHRNKTTEQEILEQTINLSVNDIELKTVLAKIEQLSKVKFVYNPREIKVTQKISIGAKNEQLKHIFKKLFQPLKINYDVNGRQIVLFKQNVGMLENAPESPATDKNITGQITDDTKNSIVGATVFLKGTNKGTTSDANGKYSLSIPDQGAVLAVSYIGYIKQEIEITNQSEVNFELKADVKALDEVVVGYGTVKKSDLTGAVSSISSKDFEKQPLTRADQALQGRSAGVTVTQTSGSPGAALKIRVRGPNSISGSNDPLYVVDGMIVENINAVNINDVQSIEVLKDASATAVYGSRGANGVVLFTTKSGKKGETQIELNYFTGTSSIIQELSVMNAAEFAEGVNFAEGKQVYTAAEIQALKDNGGENWQKKLFKTAASSNYQISANGGSDKVNYFVSGNLSDADGTIASQNYKKYSFRTNLNAQLTSKLNLGLNIFGAKDIASGAKADLSSGLAWDPTTPAFKTDGSYNEVTLKPGIGAGVVNPLIQPENNKIRNTNTQLSTNLVLDYKITKNLTFNTISGINNSDIINNSYTSILVDGLGTALVLNRDISRIQNTNRLTYRNEINKNHTVQLDLVHEQQSTKKAWNEARSVGFFSDNTSYFNLGLGASQKNTNLNTSESLQSFLGRINYSLFDKFLLTASMRADGSSKFQKDNRWGYFPSASVAYRLSEESFIRNSKTISDLKLRVSYGITGNQGIEPLATKNMPIIQPGTGPFDGINYAFDGNATVVGVAPSTRLANPNLTWEKTRQLNAGIDASFFSNKLYVSLDVYKKWTSDLLLDIFLPEFVGPTISAKNVGSVENKGIDLTLSYRTVSKKDFGITNSLNVSAYQNKVTGLVNDKPIEKGELYGLAGLPVKPTRVEVGQPISSFRGYVFEGVYQANEADQAAKFNRKPGDAKYKDLNNDGKITSDDITIVGSGNPDFTWGLNTDMSYKRFNINMLITGSHGAEIYNLQKGRMMALGSLQFHATHADYNNRWTTTNPSNVPSGRNGTEFLSTQFVENGSYVSFKNVSLSYSFKTPFQKNAGRTTKFFVNANNLFLLTKYTGFDPEATVTGNSDVDLGIDYNSYPLSRTYNIGFNLKF